MNNNLTAFQHQCSLIRRQVELEYKNIRLFFLLHRNNERKQEIERQKNKILAAPIGDDILKLLDSRSKASASEFLGLVKHPAGVFDILKKNQYTAVICINTDLYSQEELFKHILYSMIWQVLSLFDKIHSKSVIEKPSSNVIFAPSDRLSQSRENLLGDIYSSILMEYFDHDGFIKTLALQRSQEIMSDMFFHEAELFPYPLGYETAELIAGDLKNHADATRKLLKTAYDITKAASIAYEDETIKHWWSFARPAQFMAWAGISTEKILGAAVFTSQNAYVRTNAMIVADLLEIEPSLLAENTDINAYAHPRKNSQLHAGVCDIHFFKLCQKVMADGSYLDFYRKAYEQCEDLIHQRPLGFCAPALVMAARAFKNEALQNDALEQASLAFYKELGRVNWKDIWKASLSVFAAVRKGKEFDPKDAGKILAKINPDLKDLADLMQEELSMYEEQDGRVNLRYLNAAPGDKHSGDKQQGQNNNKHDTDTAEQAGLTESKDEGDSGDEDEIFEDVEIIDNVGSDQNLYSETIIDYDPSQHDLSTLKIVEDERLQ